MVISELFLLSFLPAFSSYFFAGGVAIQLQSTIKELLGVPRISRLSKAQRKHAVNFSIFVNVSWKLGPGDLAVVYVAWSTGDTTTPYVRILPSPPFFSL